MKKTLLLVYIIMASVISGCASSGINISKKGLVVIEPVASEKAYIPWADAYQDGNNLMIKGTVKQRHRLVNASQVYINAVIIDAQGQLLKEARTADVSIPRKSSCKCNNWARFELTVPVIVAKDMRIFLVVDGA